VGTRRQRVRNLRQGYNQSTIQPDGKNSRALPGTIQLGPDSERNN
jgi:hypothetical protein